MLTGAQLTRSFASYCQTNFESACGSYSVMSHQITRSQFSRFSPSNSRTVLVIFAAMLTGLLFGVLFPWFPGGQAFDAGTIAKREIVSPRDANYISDVLTEKLRNERAAEVVDVLVFDTALREQQLQQLDVIFGEIDEIRNNSKLSASARETMIRLISNTDLSTRSAMIIVSFDPAQWHLFTDEARTTLATTLGAAIGPDDVLSARSRAASLLPPTLEADQIMALRELIYPLVVPTLTVDVGRTALLRRAARANTLPVRIDVSRAEIVIQGGSILSEADVEALDQLGIRSSGREFSLIAATAVISLLSAVGVTAYLAVARPRTVHGSRRVLLLGLLLVMPVAAAKFALPLVAPDFDRHFLAHALPLAAGPIAAAVLLDVAVAVLLTSVLTILVIFSSVYAPGFDTTGTVAQLETARLAMATFAGSLAGVFVAANADRLQRFLAAGIAVAVAAGIVVLPIWLIDPESNLVDIVWLTGSVAVSGLLSALIGVGVFVLLSRPFGIITRVELMELAQLSQPLLRRLQDEAPGTFQHSILVGNLAERAADRIGADPLLARVGAYYHDIGKLSAPGFFIENTGNVENPHEGLDPLQSTRVILQHVTGGIELARRSGLPNVLIQFIQQHHGQRLVSFFYRRAFEVDPDIDPDLFRYPGPRPQSPEVALVMLADSCEAATRASSDRSADSIRAIVTDTFRERIDEGEFDEAPISLRDLAVAREAYIATLTAVFHPRVEYPEPTKRELEVRGRVSHSEVTNLNRVEGASPDDSREHFGDSTKGTADRHFPVSDKIRDSVRELDEDEN